MMPNNIQIEPVEGCNRRCGFCGIHALYDANGKMKIHRMEPALFYAAIDSLADWGFQRKRIEFGVHGEPTLHPDLVAFVAYIKKKMPRCQLQLISNCKVLLSQSRKMTFRQLFAAGLNILATDTYDGETPAVQKEAKRAHVPYHSYYNKDCPNPYHYQGGKDQMVVDFKNLAAVSGRKLTRTILNHAGNLSREACQKFGAHFVTSPLRKLCSRTHREIVLHYDGTIPICCMDWRHEMIMGQFPQDGSFQEIWEGEVFALARELHYRKIRKMRPCAWCDYKGGFRLGFLKPVAEYAETSTKELLKRFVNAYAHAADCKSKRPILVKGNTLLEEIG